MNIWYFSKIFSHSNAGRLAVFSTVQTGAVESNPASDHLRDVADFFSAKFQISFTILSFETAVNQKRKTRKEANQAAK